MKLKNEALQELYDTIVNCTITISPFADSPVDEAFKECDRELANLQNRNDILEKSNGTLLDANLDLCSKNRDLKKRIEQLEKNHESDVRVIGKLHSQMVNLEDEKTEQEKRADILKTQKDELIDKNTQLQQEIEQLKNQLDGAIEDKKSLVVSRYKWAQKWLSTKQNLEAKLNEAEVKYRRLEKEYEKLASDYLTITTENKRLQDGLRDIGYEQGQTDLWDKLQNVNDSQPNEFDVECEGMEDVIGMDLEDFLDAYKKWQDQKDIDRMRDWQEREETDRMREWLDEFCNKRCSCIGCPLEGTEYKCGCGYSFRGTNSLPDGDIKRCYEKARGCGRYTLNDGKLLDSTTMEGVNRAITKACETFCKAVRDADIKIKENIPRNGWECTLEAKVEVDKDLVENAFGIKLEDEKPNPKGLVITTRGVTTANYTEATMNAIKEAVRKFEKSLPALESWESTITGSIKVDDILGKANDPDHKLEYGDAVRLPWRDYDYMYIDADKKHIRLFNPKTHTVVLVSPSEKLTYQGCKIVLTDEEDLRKIWKDKK